MPTLVLCSEQELEPRLAGSALLRAEIGRFRARRADDARMLAIAARPELALVDAELPGALELVAALREEPLTRALSLGVLLARPFETRDVAFLDAGANALLSLPPATDFDARVGRLLRVPVRREARLPVRLSVDSLRSRAVADARALTLDLSEAGMRIEVQAELRVGDRIDFALRLGRGGAAVGGSGRVVRQPGPGCYGVEFAELGHHGRQQIGRFVAASR
jgi:DNA-binding response OmpR family regulator